MKTLEQKEAWVLRKINLEILHGILIDKQYPKIIILENGDDLYVSKQDEIYNSLEAATEAKKEWEERVKELIRGTKHNIEILEGLSRCIANPKDYIPEHYLNDNYYKSYYDRYDNLIRYVNTGVLNINAESFTKDSIVEIKWGEDCAEIVLMNGSKVRTYTEQEFDLITDIFGINYSDRVFTDIKLEKDEEDD